MDSASAICWRVKPFTRENTRGQPGVGRLGGRIFVWVSRNATCLISERALPIVLFRRRLFVDLTVRCEYILYLEPKCHAQRNQLQQPILLTAEVCNQENNFVGSKTGLNQRRSASVTWTLCVCALLAMGSRCVVCSSTSCLSAGSNTVLQQ